MSSVGSQNRRPGPLRNAAERSLTALKMHGALTTAALAHILGTSGEAVRQQLVRLTADGLVEATAEPKGIGRPAWRWQLTPAARLRFPDAHAALAVQLLRIVRSDLGEGALGRLIETRERQMCAAYASDLSRCRSLRRKLERLAELRSAEGYMADVRAEPSGAFMLIENHCPICMAAAECRQFCQAEQAVFETLLGTGVAVERVEHIAAGDDRCAYRIVPQQAAAAMA